uniref:Uncharacterized protein n=1 Tax=Panagrolaimus davidi TaxID=227884 RepID=A0A914R3L8_9BILA
MKHRIDIFLILFSSSFLIVESLVCAEYSQDFTSPNKIDASKHPALIVYSDECKGCIATIKNGKFKASSVQNSSHFGWNLCETSKPFNCDDKTCCCRGEFCYDRLRNYFASTPPIKLTECIVQRKTSTESGATNSSYWRNSCSICVAEKHGNAIESRCIEPENLEYECSFATELIGENLACTKNLKKCCCRSKNCQEQFEKYFFKHGELGHSLISEPYASTVAKLKTSSTNSLQKLSHVEILLTFIASFWLL